VDGDNPVMGNAYQSGGTAGSGGRGPEGGLIPTTPYLASQTPQHMMGSETPHVYGSMTPR
jgi:hypothetical protein